MKKTATTLLLTALMALCGAVAAAQQRNATLTVKVQTEITDDLTGQAVTLEQTDYAVTYGTLKLDAEGSCTVKVYPGNHRLTVERPGYETGIEEFAVADGDPDARVSLTLREKTRAPFALKAGVRHDAATGRNDIDLSWNVEEPVFTDDFESYSPFAITFGGWSGIDADGEATAALVGSYPNRGVMQYAQIINPLTVVPTWWYDYPILHPYSGKQYIGFIRTESGRANDDWLISPAITPGTDNVLEFMAKAADRYPERFMVYVTTSTENPSADDFTRIDTGNFESVDYRGWKKFSYDLSAYAGKEIKFAIRYVSDANRYGAFMLMIDDVFVGQPAESAASMTRKAVRAMRSPGNPYEQFNIYLDGAKAGTTDGYSFTLDNIAAGHHTLGVEASYRQAVSDITEIEVNVADGPFAKVAFNVEALSKLAADRIEIALLNLDSGEQLTVTTDCGTATLLSLPHGRYNVYVEEGVYNAFSREVEINSDTEVDIKLEDHIIDPYNITADVDAENGSVTLRWNRELGFKDSFETYDDFATGEFGEWRTIDRDQSPVYPIALGSQTNIVSFPGSGNASNPTAIAPMVFNPWKTVPAMLPTDQAIEASDGEKSVIFFSPQMAKADKWLISPMIEIREGYEVKFKAKAYSAMYAESLEICVSEGSTNPDDFVVMGEIESLASEAWGEYSMDLSEYAGKSIRVAVRYTSYDAFLVQVDEFEVGKPDGQGDYIDYGNVVGYDIYLDGNKVGESTQPEYVVTGVGEGQHTAGIVTRYLHSNSAMSEYTFGVSSAIDRISADIAPESAETEIFDISGRRVERCAESGIYIIRQGGKIFKQVIK